MHSWLLPWMLLNVRWTQKVLCCDHCDVWFHGTCVGVTWRAYEDLGNTSDSRSYFPCKLHLPLVPVRSSRKRSICHPIHDNMHRYDTLSIQPIKTQQPIWHSTRDSQESRPHTSLITAQLLETYASREGKRATVIIRKSYSADGKLPEIHNMCNYLDPDFIMMSETKIDSSVATMNLKKLGYLERLSHKPNDSLANVVFLLRLYDYVFSSTFDITKTFQMYVCCLLICNHIQCPALSQINCHGGVFANSWWNPKRSISGITALPWNKIAL